MARSAYICSFASQHRVQTRSPQDKVGPMGREEVEDELTVKAMQMLAAEPMSAEELAQRLNDQGAFEEIEDLWAEQVEEENGPDAYLALELERTAEELGEERIAALGELLMQASWEAADGRLHSISTALEGLIFTHRLTEDEIAAATIPVDPDLTVIDWGIDQDSLALEGGASLSHSIGGDYDPSGLVGPKGWLEGFGAGDLVGMRRIGVEGEVRLEKVDRPGSGEAETKALLEQLQPFFDRSEGAGIVAPLMTAIVGDETLFRSPVVPIGEALLAAGCEQRRDHFGPRDRPWEIADGQLGRTVVSMLVDRMRLSPCCDSALRTILDAWQLHIYGSKDPSASTDIEEVARALTHGGVALDFYQLIGASPHDREMLDFTQDLLDDLDDLDQAEGAEDDATQRPGAMDSAPRYGVAALLGLLLDKLGEPFEAEQLFLEVLKVDSGNPTARIRLAGIEFDRGNLAEAARYGQGVLAADDPLALLLAAEPKRGATARRNDRCPCGSGRKYKACHIGRELLSAYDTVERIFLKALHWAGDNAELGAISTMLQTAGYDPDELAKERLIVEVYLFSLGGAAEFADARRDLLPPEESALLVRWLLDPPRLLEVLQVDPERTIFVDVDGGEEFDVTTPPTPLPQGGRFLVKIATLGDEQLQLGQAIRVVDYQLAAARHATERGRSLSSRTRLLIPLAADTIIQP